MNERGKSDKPVVPRKSANTGGAKPLMVEWMEGRGLARGNPNQQNESRTQRREAADKENPKRARSGKPRIQPRGDTCLRSHDSHSALDRVREAAQRDKGLRFTTLWHHVCDIERLRKAYRELKKDAAPGIDGQTWLQYGQELEQNLQDLSRRLQRGAYRAKPVRRGYIPKPDGRQRPIGVPVLEDKIVQRATAEVLGAVYEVDFRGFSYGFRPKRGAHNALDALSVGISKKKVSWVLDADIRGFFDALSHEWLVKFIEHRIADRRVVRQIQKWLNAGVLEDGCRTYPEEGSPQGGSISPVLANVYLHYVFDLWADHWRRTQSHGDVIIVRYADDFVVGFQNRKDAEADDPAAYASETETGQRDPSASHACAHPRSGRVVAVGGERILPLLRRPAKLPGASGIPLSSDWVLATDATATKPEEPHHLGENEESGPEMDSHPANPASLSRGAADRQDLRQEPSAVTPLAGIRGGGGM